MRIRPFLPNAFTDYSEDEADFDLFRLFNGGLPQARVGRIPRWLANAIRSGTTIVILTKACAQKIRFKHDITFEDLQALAVAFHDGHAIRDTRTDIAFLFKSPRTDRGMIKAVIKATRDGNELFVKTMHHISGHRLKRAQKKGLILRGERV